MEKIDIGKTSYADIAKKNSNPVPEKIKSFLLQEKQEERKIKSTNCNLIIHGVDESVEESLEELNKAEKYIEN